jgi:hypothetical protein
MLKVAVLILLFSGAGCATVGAVLVPKTSAATCSTQCHDIGLTLDSVVIMAANVGCVCAAAPAAGSRAPGSAAGGGMAAILMQQAAAQSHSSTTSSR